MLRRTRTTAMYNLKMEARELKTLARTENQSGDRSAAPRDLSWLESKDKWQNKILIDIDFIATTTRLSICPLC